MPWPPDALPNALAVLLLAGFAVCGAWLDWRFRRLPNWLCGSAFCAGLAVAALGGGVAAVAPHLLHAVIALAVGMALFAGGLIGGGDAKYYAALAAWFPLADGFRLLLLVALAGLVLTTAMWISGKRQPARTGAGPRQMVPFGVAIAAGALAGTVC